MARSSEKGQKLDLRHLNVNPKRIIDGAICLIPNCKKPMVAGNYCMAHYLRGYFTPQNHKRPRRKLAQEIGQILGISREEATKIMRIVQDSMTQALRREEKVHIAGFGIFDLKPNRKGIRNRVYFKPAKELRYMVNHKDYNPGDPEC